MCYFNNNLQYFNCILFNIFCITFYCIIVSFLSHSCYFYVPLVCKSYDKKCKGIAPFPGCLSFNCHSPDRWNILFNNRKMLSTFIIIFFLCVSLFLVSVPNGFGWEMTVWVTSKKSPFQLHSHTYINGFIVIGSLVALCDVTMEHVCMRSSETMYAYWYHCSYVAMCTQEALTCM